MGKIFVFCRIRLKYCTWLYKKHLHKSWKFQLEITSNEKVIAKKPLTDLYEMNSSVLWSNLECPKLSTEMLYLIASKFSNHCSLFQKHFYKTYLYHVSIQSVQKNHVNELQLIICREHSHLLTLVSAENQILHFC